MTLKATIQPTKEFDQGGNYPVVYTYNEGVVVGAAGELTLISDRGPYGNPTEFRIYAPGTWKEVNVELHKDE